jgi:hypothetical protein
MASAISRSVEEYKWWLNFFDKISIMSVEKAYATFIRLPGNKDVLYDYLVDRMRGIVDKSVKFPKRRANILAWPWAYMAQACMLGYQNSHDERFLDLFIDSFDDVLDLRDSSLEKKDTFHNKVMRAWGSGSHIQGEWICHTTSTGRITFPAAMFVNAVNRDKKLFAKYKRKATQYFAAVRYAIEDQMVDYRMVSSDKEGYFLRAGYGTVEPLNHAHAFGSTVAVLYELTGEKQYFDIASSLASFFLNRVRKENNGSYSWSYNPDIEYSDQDPPEPYWKAGITTQFAHVAYHAGIVFNVTDMESMAKTFTLNIFQGNNKYNRHISQNNIELIDPNEKLIKGKIRLLTNWIHFGHFDSKVIEITCDAVSYRTDIFKKGWFSSFSNSIAYAYRIKNAEL